jgi:hypothetical protein
MNRSWHSPTSRRSCAPPSAGGVGLFFRIGAQEENASDRIASRDHLIRAGPYDVVPSRSLYWSGFAGRVSSVCQADAGTDASQFDERSTRDRSDPRQPLESAFGEPSTLAESADDEP